MTMQAEPLSRAALSTEPLLDALRVNRVLLVIVGLHVAAALVVSHLTATPFQSTTNGILVTALQVLIPAFLVALFLMRFVWMAVAVRPRNPTRWFLADIRAIVLDADRLLTGIVAFAAVSVMCGTFAYLKDMIPHLLPFAWDETFAAWDRALHGGVDPWRLLVPFFGTPGTTAGINLAYNLWFLLVYFSAFYACFDTRNRARSMTFLIAFVLCWILGGNLLATLLSSVGPAFYADFGYGDLFAPQIAMLNDFAQTHAVWAPETQRMLLDGFHGGSEIKGISAMPSMHVTIAVLVAIYGFAIRRWLGLVLALYAAVIMVGSVHLAWHYALDGYLGAVIAFACWWMGARLQRRFCPEG
ncbi:phosphatase PAP2 family protein [Roseovarius sp. SCSIO 43702]|uniref:phosphatase PAP2 family protein n=1 Tax=Roseovarius sp. SCSIO 43702 TaxID=2823043 RepID=UPI001C72CBFD|nr:phosphatase PAP2 family protein [Roseovarius sp. SCSIO 43702]QYX55850.1 phosphatase PAP2 family protein [Roseovarius sp. SCSIO 43702]